MDFTQLLSIASKNASRQEKASNGVASTNGGGETTMGIGKPSRVAKSKTVDEDAIRRHLEEKRQQNQDRAKQMIEERRALLEKRLEKRKQAKQKEREEAMAKSMETLKEEERRKQARKLASMQPRPENNLPKNNIRAQFSTGISAEVRVQNTPPPPPMDFQSLMKMAANRTENGMNMNQKVMTLPEKSNKASLDEEMVHLKKVKSKPVQRNLNVPSRSNISNESQYSNGRQNGGSSSNSSISSNSSDSKQVPNLNGATLSHRTDQGYQNGVTLKSKGIAAQSGLSNNSANNSKTISNGFVKATSNGSVKATRTETRLEEPPEPSRPKFKSKGIAAQLASQPSGKISSANNKQNNHQTSQIRNGLHNQSRSQLDIPSRSESKQRESEKVSSIGSKPDHRSSSNSQRSMPQRPVASNQGSRPRGIAAQLGINTNAKRRFEMQQQMYDEELDYDSEMDDFIDDEDEELGIGGGDGNYSSAAEDAIAELRKVTGYDPTRYNDHDISDFELRRSMTASFSDIAKEEKRSERIGKKEDALEYKKEQDRMKMKAAKRAKTDEL